MRHVFQYGLLWLARLLTGLLLAAGGCGVLFGVATLADSGVSSGMFGRDEWGGVVLTAGSGAIVIAAFVFHRAACRAIERWRMHDRDQARGFEVLLTGRRDEQS